MRIRPRKDGGVSACNSPEELVGRGRCCHILDENAPTMELKQIQRGSYEVKIEDSVISISAQQEDIVKFFNSLGSISEEKQNKIIEFLSQ